MAGPPTDIEPSDLWLKLCEWPRPSEVVDFPRFDANGKPISKVRIQVLTQGDHDTARLAATARMKSRKLSPEDLQGLTVREVFGDAVAKELLAMACLTAEPARGGDPDKPIYGRIFRNADDLDKLMSDELAVLFNQYLLVQSKYGPLLKGASPEDTEAWIKRLATGAGDHFLAHLPLPELARLTSSLAQTAYMLFRCLASHEASLPDTLKSELKTFVTDISYYGSPQEEPTENTYLGRLPDRPISLEEATDLARSFRDL